MTKTKPVQKRRMLMGKLLIALSFILWGSISILPFVDIPNRILIGTIMYGFSYLLFFIGGYFVGAGSIKSWKKRFTDRFFSTNS